MMAGPITALSAQELVRELAGGDLSSEEAVAAHIARLEEVDPALAAVTTPRYGPALAEARSADRLRSRGGALGALHGLPITVKDQFDVAGLPTSFGVARLRERPVARDGAMVAALRAAGAVVVAKTNVPQGLGLYETLNGFVGPTANPWDTSRTPGGSSGGEAAVVAAGASPLGLAGDFGGSLRVPATWCGVATLKPTARRLPLDHAPVRTASGWEGLVGQPGPIARTVADVALGLEVLVDASLAERTAGCPPVPWRDPAQVEVGELRVAILDEVDGYRPAPAVRRALRESADVLRAAGAHVERWATPPDTAAATELVMQLFSADGFAFARQVIGDDPRHPLVASDLQLMAMPAPLRRLLRTALRATGQRTLARLLDSLRRTSAAGLMDLLGDRVVYERSWRRALDVGRFDLVLCPAAPLPAPPHGSTASIPHAFTSATLFNLLGWPAGVVPVTTVRPGEESDRPRALDRCQHAARTAELGSCGLPVGVQLAAPPWQEHLILAAMSAVEAGVVTRAGFPTTPRAVTLQGGHRGQAGRGTAVRQGRAHGRVPA